MYIYPNYYKKTFLSFHIVQEWMEIAWISTTTKLKNKTSTKTENKKIFNIDDIDVNKILVSKKEQYGKYNSFKYFIGYNDNDVIKPLYLGLSQMTGYIKKFDEDKNKNKRP